MFADGKLQGPFTCMTGEEAGLSFRKMQNGRPADKVYGTYFHEKGLTEYVNSLTDVSDVSGEQFYSGQWINALWHGEGKVWLSDARIFIGQFETDQMKQGGLYEL